MSVIFLVPRTTHAQSCCGEAIAVQVDCPNNCGSTFLYQCNEYGGNDWMAVAQFQCGSGDSCNRISSWEQAGYCFDAAHGSASTVAQKESRDSGKEDAAYVNAYVMDCRGEYVAVRLAMRRTPA